MGTPASARSIAAHSRLGAEVCSTYRILQEIFELAGGPTAFTKAMSDVATVGRPMAVQMVESLTG